MKVFVGTSVDSLIIRILRAPVAVQEVSTICSVVFRRSGNLMTPTGEFGLLCGEMVTGVPAKNFKD